MINNILNISRLLKIDTKTTKNLISKVLKHLSEIDLEKTAPYIAKDIQSFVRRELGNPDPYAELKREYNNLMLKLIPEMENIISSSKNPYLNALKISIAGNIIDFGVNQEIDINKTIKKILAVQFAIDDSLKLKEDLMKARTVLYLGDNCGEIVTDKLFIKTIFKEIKKPEEFYFSVRGKPILNDATREDAEYIGIDELAKIIDTNDDAPGVLLENATPKFRNIFNNADVIISKGMGNFESLSDREENLYFLLITKCNLVANHLGVKKGDAVITLLNKKGSKKN